MTTDVAPALFSAIQTDFTRRVEKNISIQRLQNRIRDGTAKLAEVHDYARFLGEMLSQSLLATFTEDALPDGRLYWNIANRTIRPMLKNNHSYVNTAAKTVQKAIDEAAGIGLNPIEGELLEERLDRLIGAASQEENTFAQMQAAITEPVINCIESFFDDFIQANADFRYQSGMSPKIVRTASAGCCAWCDDLAGIYDYADTRGSDVYRRHQFCRCTVTFQNGRTQQNVWSRRMWQASEETLKARQEENLSIFRLTSAEAAQSVSESLARDRVIAEIMRTKNVSRSRAERMYRNRTRRR